MADRNERDTNRDVIEPNDAIEQGEADIEQAAKMLAKEDKAGRDQRTRKGQAQSPRELTHNEPPKHKEGHRG